MVHAAMPPLDVPMAQRRLKKSNEINEARYKKGFRKCI